MLEVVTTEDAEAVNERANDVDKSEVVLLDAVEVAEEFEVLLENKTVHPTLATGPQEYSTSAIPELLNAP